MKTLINNAASLSRTLTALAVAFIGLAACQTEPVADVPDEMSREIDEEINYVNMTIRASREDGSPATKTERDESTGLVWWTEGDDIGVFFDEGSPTVFHSEIEDGRALTADFDGLVEASATGPFWAMYPYQEGSSFDGSAVTLDLPSDQTAKAGSFASGLFPAIGYSESEEVSFFNVCGGLKLSLFRDDVVSITLRDNNPEGESLTGKASVGLNSEGIPVVLERAASAHEITIKNEDGEPFQSDRFYYFIMYPVIFSQGFTVTFTTSSGNVGTYTRTTAKSIVSVKRSVFGSLTALDTFAEWENEQIEQRPDIVPAAVRQYLEAAPSEYEDDLDVDIYTKSVISDYTAGSKVSAPQPVEFSSPSEAATFRISLSGDFRKGTTVDLAGGSLTWGGTHGLPSTGSEIASFSSTGVSLYNLTPDVKYYYEFLDADGNVIERLVLSPTGPLRMIKLAGNGRDLGGWKSESFEGLRMSYGKIYRGQQLGSSSGGPGGGSSSSGSSDVKSIFFNTLGAGVDIDLRGLGSGSANNPLEPDYYWNFPVRQFMYSDEKGSGSYDPTNAGDTPGLYQAAIRKIIGHLEAGVPVYFHCIGGADRTGTLALLIEALCGVSEMDINLDYELTSFATSRLRNDTGTRPFPFLVKYLKTFEGDTFQKKVETWAKTQFEDTDKDTGEVVPALTDSEISSLRMHMLEAIPSDN